MNSTSGTSGLGNELRDDAQQITSAAGSRLQSEVDSRKSTVATQAQSVGSAIERAAGELDEEAPQWLKSAFQQGATQVRRFADTLEQKDSREILRDVQTIARENPGTFLAGCAAIGFAAARIFKAGANEGSGSQQRQQPQFPPAQVDEPMFRPEGTQPISSRTSTGEFA